ncbi:MAG: response regulator transcription factor [Chthoniobacter sp.]|nr:response regulator transcription factor [Chthoniobacter sp.]
MSSPTPNADGKRRVFLVDDHPLVREGLTTLINQQKDFVVCGEAEDAPEALQAIEREQPDAAVVDITLAIGSGIELIKDIRCVAPKVAIVVLSMHDEALYAERALRAGARGYVMKRETTKKIVTALREVLEGRRYVSEEFRAAATDKFIDGSAGMSVVEQLSDRELEVFRQLGTGQETRRIAESLGISMKTVQVYFARIKEKLNLGNITEVRREAVRWWESQNQT